MKKNAMYDRTNVQKALKDISDGYSKMELSIFLGWRDVKKHYTRSLLGPLWLTLSMGFMVLGLGILYSEIFKIDVAVYLPRLAIGLILWGFINGLVNGSCSVFTAAGASIRQVKLPLSLYVFQFVWSQVLTLSHNFLIYIIVAIVFMINPGVTALLFVPAMVIIILNGVFIALILGPLCARFRDVPMIIGSVMQIVFFMTPILWSTESMPQRAWFLLANPFYHFIEIVRDPLLGSSGTALNWLVCIAITVVMGVTALLFFSRYRARVVYWS